MDQDLTPNWTFTMSGVPKDKDISCKCHHCRKSNQLWQPGSTFYAKSLGLPYLTRKVFLQLNLMIVRVIFKHR